MVGNFRETESVTVEQFIEKKHNNLLSDVIPVLDTGIQIYKYLQVM